MPTLGELGTPAPYQKPRVESPGEQAVRLADELRLFFATHPKIADLVDKLLQIWMKQRK